MLKSPPMAPFNEQPAMKAKEITDHVCQVMSEYDFIRINYPNGDMVGHTGDLPAVIAAMEALDAQLHRLEQAVTAAGGILVGLAYHGNDDDMTKTAHTLNPVPFVIRTPQQLWPAVDEPGWPMWRQPFVGWGLIRQWITNHP